jgi:hypothetical protein
LSGGCIFFRAGWSRRRLGSVVCVRFYFSFWNELDTILGRTFEGLVRCWNHILHFVSGHDTTPTFAITYFFAITTKGPLGSAWYFEKYFLSARAIFQGCGERDKGSNEKQLHHGGLLVAAFNWQLQRYCEVFVFSSKNEANSLHVTLAFCEITIICTLNTLLASVLTELFSWHPKSGANRL